MRHDESHEDLAQHIPPKFSTAHLFMRNRETKVNKGIEIGALRTGDFLCFEVVTKWFSDQCVQLTFEFLL